jgi:integrase
MITLYRRHLQRCAHREEGRKHRNCACPLWAQGTLGAERIRESLNTTSWKRASGIVLEWEAAGTRQPKPAPVADRPTWADLEKRYKAEAERRIALPEGAKKKLAASTWKRYQQTIKFFGDFLTAQGVSRLEEINRSLVEDFKAWRFEETRKRKQSRGGSGVTLDVAILHAVFAYATKSEMLARNPVEMEGRPGDNPDGGAEAFDPRQLARLREHAGGDTLAFLLLRHTGLRGGDAAGLTWAEIDWEAREINRLTQKRRKRVVVPIHTELLFALEAERDRRSPGPDDRVLLMEPDTGKPFTRPKLYNRIVALGKRAGVPHAHPHRFRDTFAVDMLAKGASLYEVAKLLGDTVETTEEHYARFVLELRERARRIMETDGLEKAVGTPRVRGQSASQRVQWTQ